MILYQIMALLGILLMFFLPGIGSTLATARAGMATIGAMKKREGIFGGALMLTALPGTHGLYGFVSFVLYNQALSQMVTTMTFFKAAVVLTAGIIVGVVCFVAAMYQSRVCTDGIASMGAGNDVFGNTMVLAAFPEFYSILALVVAILAMGLLRV